MKPARKPPDSTSVKVKVKLRSKRSNGVMSVMTPRYTTHTHNIIMTPFIQCAEHALGEFAGGYRVKGYMFFILLAGDIPM